jgi:glycine cleavage system H protein
VIPENLRYTTEHEWIRPGDGPLRMGITHFAQDALGDIVFVQLPDPGTAVEAGQSLGEIESTKSVSDFYAPITGTISARNDRLADAPELVNSDPYGEGWLVEIEPTDASALDGLLDPAAYEKITAAGH